VACIDIRHIARFCYSVALARGLAHYTELRWVEYRESGVLNLIYTAMPWKGRPGYVEVDTNVVAAREMALKQGSQYQKKFYDKLAASPGEAGKYMSDLERIKSDSIEWMQQIYKEGADINKEVVRETTKGLIALRTIKIGAGLAVAYGSAGALPIAYTVATSVIDNWDDLKKAVIIGGLDIGSGKGAEHAIKIAGQKISAQEVLVREAQSIVSAKHAELMRKVSSNKIAKVGRQLGKAEANLTQQTSQLSKLGKLSTGAKVVGKTLPLLFAIPDAMDLIDDVRSL
jgi:hypothetical protein